MTTHFQQKLYQYIVSFLNENHASPTYADMANAMGISATSLSLITRSLAALEKEGKLAIRKEGRRKYISFPKKRLPLLGKIPAGTPNEPFIENHYIEAEWLSQPNHFALVVDGTSMIDEHICDGDIVVCKSTEQAREGDIVVALIDSQNVTLKKISFKLKDHITLIPANKELKPRAYAAERILIQGVFVGLIRNFA